MNSGNHEPTQRTSADIEHDESVLAAFTQKHIDSAQSSADLVTKVMNDTSQIHQVGVTKFAVVNDFAKKVINLSHEGIGLIFSEEEALRDGVSSGLGAILTNEINRRMLHNFMKNIRIVFAAAVELSKDAPPGEVAAINAAIRDASEVFAAFEKDFERYNRLPKPMSLDDYYAIVSKQRESSYSQTAGNASTDRPIAQRGYTEPSESRRTEQNSSGLTEISSTVTTSASSNRRQQPREASRVNGASADAIVKQSSLQRSGRGTNHSSEYNYPALTVPVLLPSQPSDMITSDRASQRPEIRNLPHRPEMMSEPAPTAPMYPSFHRPYPFTIPASGPSQAYNTWPHSYGSPVPRGAPGRHYNNVNSIPVVGNRNAGASQRPTPPQVPYQQPRSASGHEKQWNIPTAPRAMMQSPGTSLPGRLPHPALASPAQSHNPRSTVENGPRRGSISDVGRSTNPESFASTNSAMRSQENITPARPRMSSDSIRGHPQSTNTERGREGEGNSARTQSTTEAGAREVRIQNQVPHPAHSSGQRQDPPFAADQSSPADPHNAVPRRTLVNESGQLEERSPNIIRAKSSSQPQNFNEGQKSSQNTQPNATNAPVQGKGTEFIQNRTNTIHEPGSIEHAEGPLSHQQERSIRAVTQASDALQTMTEQSGKNQSPSVGTSSSETAPILRRSTRNRTRRRLFLAEDSEAEEDEIDDDDEYTHDPSHAEKTVPHIFDTTRPILLPVTLRNRENLVESIKAHGGRLTVRIASDCVIVADDVYLKRRMDSVKAAMLDKRLFVVRPRWIDECLKQKKWLDPQLDEYRVDILPTSLKGPPQRAAAIQARPAMNGENALLRILYTKEDCDNIVHHLAITRSSWKGKIVGRELSKLYGRHSAQSYQTHIRDNMEVGVKYRFLTAQYQLEVGAEKLELNRIRMEAELACKGGVQQGEGSIMQSRESQTLQYQPVVVDLCDTPPPELQLEQIAHVEAPQNLTTSSSPLSQPPSVSSQQPIDQRSIISEQNIQKEAPEHSRDNSMIRKAIINIVTAFNSGNSPQRASRASFQEPSKNLPQMPSQKLPQTPLKMSSQASVQNPSQTFSQKASQISPQMLSQKPSQASAQNPSQKPSQASAQNPSQISPQMLSQKTPQRPSQNSPQISSQKSSQVSLQTSSQKSPQISLQMPSQKSPQKKHHPDTSKDTSLNLPESTLLVSKLAEWIVTLYSNKTLTQPPVATMSFSPPDDLFQALEDEAERKIPTEFWKKAYFSHRNVYHLLAEKRIQAFPSQYLEQPMDDEQASMDELEISVIEAAADIERQMQMHEQARRAIDNNSMEQNVVPVSAKQVDERDILGEAPVSLQNVSSSMEAMLPTHPESEENTGSQDGARKSEEEGLEDNVTIVEELSESITSAEHKVEEEVQTQLQVPPSQIVSQSISDSGSEPDSGAESPHGKPLPLRDSNHSPTRNYHDRSAWMKESSPMKRVLSVSSSDQEFEKEEPRTKLQRTSSHTLQPGSLSVFMDPTKRNMLMAFRTSQSFAHHRRGTNIRSPDASPLLNRTRAPTRAFGTTPNMSRYGSNSYSSMLLERQRMAANSSGSSAKRWQPSEADDRAIDLALQHGVEVTVVRQYLDATKGDYDLVSKLLSIPR